MENPFTGEAKWVDVTVAHTGADTYREKEIKALQARQLATVVSSSLALPDPFLSDPSPTLLERCATKLEKYSRLIHIAKKQVLEFKRAAVPAFTAFALSDYGEISPAAKDLLDWVTAAYRAKCTAEPSTDGVPLMELVRNFKYRVRLSLQLALAAGCGEMLCKAGQAWR